MAGGVADHTRLLADALASAGEDVHVWAPGSLGVVKEGGVTVHRTPGRFAPGDLRTLSRELDACQGPRRLLLQYVPHALGLRAMNVPFCAWFAARRQDERQVFVHEAVYPWVRRAPLRHQVLAAATRVMLRLVAEASDRVYVSIPAWTDHLSARVKRRTDWRPVPSNLPTEVSPEQRARARASLPEGTVVGHFGTYGQAIARILEPALVQVLEADAGRLGLLLGRGSGAFREQLAHRHPALAERLHARDALSSEEASAFLRACDVLLQPYPDGISTRRGSAMAGLSLGVPMVTNTGHLTEPLWRDELPVALVEGVSPSALAEATEDLLARDDARRALGTQAASLYRERFSLERTVEVLLNRPRGTP
jgi:glycosyltransferase involved in cell wall biosynthesis